MFRLAAWGNAWFEYRLAEKGRRPSIQRRSADGDRPTHGFGSHEPVYWLLKRFYAVYGDNGRFIFQAGRQYWDLTEGPIVAEFGVRRSGIASDFSVYSRQVLVHQARLIHISRAIWPRIDPAYDFIDAESAHFLFFLGNQMHDDDWRQRIVDMAEDAG